MSLRLANAYCVASANRSNDYGELLSNGAPNFPDGTPVALALRAARVRGPSFFRAVLAVTAEREVKHYFVGSTPEVLAALIERLRDEHPRLSIAGWHSPPFAPLDAPYLERIAAEVQARRPDIVWVGMGTPKQDFVADYIARTTKIAAVGVGAAFDFVAGSVSEAPRWVQRSGIEWLYRLTQEPRRLWKRYFMGNAQFVFDLVRFRRDNLPAATPR